MKAENLVVSLDTAKKLNWQKETLLYWTIEQDGKKRYEYVYDYYLSECENYPAPTAQEILEELPKEIDNHKLTIVFEKKYCFAGYENFNFFGKRSLTEALAEMYLWLKNKGYIK